MFYRLCAVAAGMAVLTEVGGRAFTVYSTWKAIHEISAVRAKAAGVTAIDKLNSMTAEPGVNVAIDKTGSSVGVDKEAQAEKKHLDSRIKELGGRNEKPEVVFRGLDSRLGKYEQVTSDLCQGDDRAVATDTNQSSLQPPSYLNRAVSGHEEKDEEKAEEEESEADAMLRIAEKNWENVLILVGARWDAEIPAEKACIIVAGFINWYFGLNDKSGSFILQVTGIFFAAEFVADALLVYILDKYFRVPFLRIPLIKSKRAFTIRMSLLAMPLITISLYIDLAQQMIEDF